MAKRRINHEEEFINAMVVVVHDCVKPEKWTWFKKQTERALGHWADLQKERLLGDVQRALDTLRKK